MAYIHQESWHGPCIVSSEGNKAYVFNYTQRKEFMMNKLVPTLIASALFAATATATAAPAMQQGQQAQQGQAMQQQQAPQVEITDELLQNFLVAMSGVQEVSQKYSEQFQNAENSEEAQAIQQKAQEEMIAEVQDAGLSTDEYNAVIQRVQQDPELQARLQSMTDDS